MTTRFYLRNTSETTDISPSPDSGWEDTSNLVRAKAHTVSTGDAMATVSAPDDGDDTDLDVILRQYVSFELAAGQTITGSQAIKAQVRAQEPDSSNNIFVALGIRVIKADGVTLNKLVLSVTRDNTELATSALTNRQFTATSAATNYTTQLGDRLVIEIGGGGNPGATGVHEFSLRLGDAAGSDLAEDDSSTTDNRPWVELADTLTFITTHTGSAAPTMGAKTCAATATHVTPTYSGFAGVTIAGKTAAATATFATGTKTGSAAVSVAPKIADVASEFVAPTYSVDAAVTMGAKVCDIEATYTAGTDTGTAAVSMGGKTASASATASNPAYSATSAVSMAAKTCAGAGKFSDYKATAAVSKAAMTCAGAATFVAPTYHGSAAVVMAHKIMGGAASAQFLEHGARYATLFARLTYDTHVFMRPTYRTDVFARPRG
ncbi:MAG: hypothetical protein RIS39_1173 [Actinomycetota bacterium]|jgi:hypothetical protein